MVEMFMMEMVEMLIMVMVEMFMMVIVEMLMMPMVEKSMIVAAPLSAQPGQLLFNPLPASQNGTLQLSGIVSWGVVPCGQSSYPSVFTNVGYFRCKSTTIFATKHSLASHIQSKRRADVYFKLKLFFFRDWIDQHLAL